MRMTEETVEGYSRVHFTRATPHRLHASHQVRKFRHLMAQIQPSSVLGLFNFEAIARHQGWTAGERVVRLVSSLTGPASKPTDRNDPGSAG